MTNHLFDCCISEKVLKITAKITTNPPIIVHWVGSSFIKIQTQIGPNVNSNNMKKVNSAANRCLDEIINKTLLKPATTPPKVKHKIKS